MHQTHIHVYLIPGMAAGPEIFENIHLPADRFKVTILEWMIPEDDESLEAYAKRMADRVDDPAGYLVGVSFGGVMAQEMKAFLPDAKVIIISSVKSRAELPMRFSLAKKSKIYQVLPTGLVVNSRNLRRFAIGPRSKKRLELYDKFLSVRNKQYLDWAIKMMICWPRETADPDVAHIHGDKDIVFPIKHIEGAAAIAGGTHAMVIYKAKSVTEQLIKLLNKGEVLG
ncbi:alpha/beta hydrolase [Gilvibacter sediminis]|uniref:alpha/beta hydrolase n=1 Tax=Gilvibacter sediminis TaxID=379071 RepID=UPI002350D950|nr:alpha/beta hydrolase [Gilvibacter sediminis]MDC7999046.1 alpha/beta hydrolase [Gilvibacter sediminis]